MLLECACGSYDWKKALSGNLKLLKDLSDSVAHYTGRTYPERMDAAGPATKLKPISPEGLAFRVSPALQDPKHPKPEPPKSQLSAAQEPTLIPLKRAWVRGRCECFMAGEIV